MSTSFTYLENLSIALTSRLRPLSLPISAWKNSHLDVSPCTSTTNTIVNHTTNTTPSSLTSAIKSCKVAQPDLVKDIVIVCGCPTKPRTIIKVFGWKWSSKRGDGIKIHKKNCKYYGQTRHSISYTNGNGIELQSPSLQQHLNNKRNDKNTIPVHKSQSLHNNFSRLFHRRSKSTGSCNNSCCCYSSHVGNPNLPGSVSHKYCRNKARLSESCIAQ